MFRLHLRRQSDGDRSLESTARSWRYGSPKSEPLRALFLRLAACKDLPPFPLGNCRPPISGPVDLPDDELAAVTAAIRRAIEDDRFPRAPRLDALKAALGPPDGGRRANRAAEGADAGQSGQVSAATAPVKGFPFSSRADRRPSNLPFQRTTAQYLMKIARDARLRDARISGRQPVEVELWRQTAASARLGTP